MEHDKEIKEIMAGRFAVKLWRASNHPGGMDWVDACSKIIIEHDEAICAEALMKVEDLIHKWWFDDGDSIETLIKAIKELKP
jgi:hypothetical protein